MWDGLRVWIDGFAPNTSRKYRSILEEFCTLMNIELDALDQLISADITHANHYFHWCKQRPAQPGRSALISDRVSMSTVRNKIICMYSIFEHLRAMDAVKSNPFEQLKRQLRKISGNDRRPHLLIPFDKVQELLKLNWDDLPHGARNRALLATLFGGGLRRSEVIKLRLIDLQTDLNGRLKLVLRDTKRQKSERQDMPDWAQKIIVAFRDSRRAEGAGEMDALFPGPKGGFFNERTFDRTFKSCIARVGLGPEYTCHSARATPITRLLDLGVSIHKVRKWARHSSIEMTEKYNKYRDRDEESVADALQYEKSSKK